MSGTPICDIVEKLLAQGLSLETVMFAARTVELSREASRDYERDAKLKAAARAKKYRENRKLSQGGMATPAVEPSRLSSRDDQNPLILSSSFLPLKKEESEEVSKKTSVVERAPRPKRKTAVALPDDWTPKLAHYDAAKKLNLNAEFVDRKAEDMRIWAKSNDNRKVDWDATFHGFIRRDNGARNGYGGSRPLQDDSRSISRAAGRLAEQADRGQFTFGPKPKLVPEANPDPVRLLPKG